MSISEEQIQQITGWNETATDFPRTQTLHELFEIQVASTPNAIAIDYQGATLSYAELNRRANQLAHYLQARGVGPEVMVGLYLQRSLEMIVGMLGILKAGGVYVPLDLEYPRQRLAFMLEDTQLPVLLTQERLPEELPNTGAQVVCLDSGWEAIAEYGGANLSGEIGPENLAYVIYTSGSTGRPKGVAVPHRAVCNHMFWMQDAFPLTETDKVLQKTPFSFDASVWEFFAPLMAGARLVIARPEAHKDPRYLANVIAEQQITRIQVVPSLLKVLLEEGLIEGCHSLRHVFCGGEALLPDLQKRFFACHRAELCNLYGPTEATIDATFSQCDRHSQLRTVPIGRPIANTQIYILDRQRQPVPIGVPGEMYIGGAGLARGYLNRPELTAERFIAHPFSDQPEARLYKTGDLTRYLPDGNIEYLGRIDHQIKLRGFRIELGEVEAALRSHIGVNDAVVTLRQGTSGEQQLVAHIVTDSVGWQSQASLQVPVLREYLEQKLPHYMVPAAYVLMDALPLTPNGKVDRRALPEPEADRSQLSSDYEAPRTPFENTLATIWQQVLKIEHIGIRDNFFELGGDSLIGAVLTNTLQDELGVKLYVVALFDAPTIVEQVAYLQKYFPKAMAVKVEDGHAPGAEKSSAEIDSQPEAEPVSPKDVEDFRRLAARWHRDSNKIEQWQRSDNPRIAYVLTTARSGSSLLRIMLAGHPRLFVPPELELLPYDSLQRRRRHLSGGIDFMREGLVRAVMELKSCDADEAQQIVSEHETRDDSVQAFYRLLQEWVGDRMLVDKSTTYSMSPQALARAEQGCEDNLYIHLVRHPMGTICSFEEARLDRVLKFQGQQQYTVRQFAELLWIASHRNTLEFLSKIPQQRQLQIRFEDLVENPQPAIESICNLLNIDFDPLMLEPYRQQERRMTDGINALSVGMTDPKFHQHSRIDAEVADAWKHGLDKDFLSEEAWRLAGLFGYERLLKDSYIAAENGQAAVQRLGADELNQLSDEEVDRRLQVMLTARRTS